MNGDPSTIKVDSQCRPTLHHLSRIRRRPLHIINLTSTPPQPRHLVRIYLRISIQHITLQAIGAVMQIAELSALINAAGDAGVKGGVKHPDDGVAIERISVGLIAAGVG